MSKNRIAWHTALAADTNGRVADPDRLRATLEEYANLKAAPTSQIEVRTLRSSTGDVADPVLGMLNSALVFEDLVSCQEEGYAAVLTAAAADAALGEARIALRIPVAGSLESSLTLTRFLGKRAALITVTPRIAAAQAELVAAYGFQGSVLPVRANRVFPFSYADFDRCFADDPDPEPVLAALLPVIEGAIADGADVIIFAFQWMGAMLWRGGALDRLPEGPAYIDCAIAGIKVAELLLAMGEAGLHKATGELSLLAAPDPAALAATVATIRRMVDS